MTIVEQLKRDEGRRVKPYQDSRGIWTVGYGHNLTTGALSEAAITQILTDDILEAETSCLIFPFWYGLSDARKGVLLNMTFNLGFAGLLGFRKFLDAVRAGQWEQAATEMLDSDWARQVGARADRLARQMVHDVWV